MCPLDSDVIELLKTLIAEIITQMEKDSVCKSLVDGKKKKKENAYANYFRYLNGGRRCHYLYILALKSTGERNEAFRISNDAREVWDYVISRCDKRRGLTAERRGLRAYERFLRSEVSKLKSAANVTKKAKAGAAATDLTGTGSRLSCWRSRVASRKVLSTCGLRAFDLCVRLPRQSIWTLWWIRVRRRLGS
jgi:hypothetical protein